MPRCVAFLRAINVGGHIVKMDRLRTLFGSLGFTAVESFIASGNVIFDTPAGDAAALEQQIERHLAAALGFAVTTFLRSTTELQEIARYARFPAATESDGYALSIAFLKAPPNPEARERLLRFRTEVDDFHIHQREVYWLCRIKVSESRFSGAVLEKALGMPTTMRNVSTVRKLTAKYPPR